MAPDATYTGRPYRSAEPYLATRTDIRAFAEAVGDPNPVYRDPAAARALGYPDIIAPPTFVVTVAGMVTRILLEDPGFGFDGGQMIHHSQRVVQHRPVVAGDLLSTRSVLERLERVGGYDRLTLRSDVCDERGGDVCTVVTVVLGPGGPTDPVDEGAGPA
ncbi:FAS1-like dehydratase domain-containing protein [Streptomyces bambusae]|uniref:MaoC family dehydratase n=1 Tax=Streptomyces bambusae TaxID=1550616 RepID=A0ABS6YY24_9ACTN|nr:MaoC family dehydratase N-terminal domain-containing protein [Streptomyces bambusae]MBW5480390.1 MaoC family dehydratase [Streptomyces bambusae]